MSGKKSRDKGARGERELAAKLTEEGFDSHRGRQYHGGPESPDITCKTLPIHWEAKRTERFSLYPSLQQAIDESPDDKIPVAAHRRNNHEWVAVLRLEDFLAILRESSLAGKETL